MTESTTTTAAIPAEVTPPEVAQPTAVITDWEAEAKKWEKRSKDNYAKLKDAEPKLAEHERMVAANKTETERATEEATRWQTEAEKWRTASVTSRIEVLAAADFTDASDAIGALAEPGKYLDASGVIDEAAIKADLADVLTRKPHWRRTAETTGPRAPLPNFAQGTGAGSGVVTGQTPADAFASHIAAALRK